MIKEKDVEILERLLKEATERLEKIKKGIPRRSRREVTKIKMIDGLTGKAIHTMKIRGAKPSNTRIAQCKTHMVCNYLGEYAFRTLSGEERELVLKPGWGEEQNRVMKERRAKIRDALKWEVCEDVEWRK